MCAMVCVCERETESVCVRVCVLVLPASLRGCFTVGFQLCDKEKNWSARVCVYLCEPTDVNTRDRKTLCSDMTRKPVFKLQALTSWKFSPNLDLVRTRSESGALRWIRSGDE